MFVDVTDLVNDLRIRNWFTVDYVSMKSGRSYRKYFDYFDIAVEWCHSHESRIFKAVLSMNSICECDIIIDDTDHADGADLGYCGNLIVDQGNLIAGQMTVDDFLT